MKIMILILGMIISAHTFANFNDPDPVGFHWYSKNNDHSDDSHLQPPKKVVISQTISQAPFMTPYQKLQYLSVKTKNTLATALLDPTPEHTAQYMYAQQYWAKQNQKFVRSWQKALLAHPDLDYSLNFPTNNGAIPIRNDEQNLLVEKTIKSMAKNDGIILFYRGNSSISQKFISILLPFIQQYHFHMVSITTDNQPIIGLPNPRSVPMQSVEHVMHLKSRYLPALFLVDLRSHKIQALSYGFIALNNLKVRFLDVSNNFKRYSYHGLGERTT